jgi:hypothetical protein
MAVLKITIILALLQHVPHQASALIKCKFINDTNSTVNSTLACHLFSSWSELNPLSGEQYQQVQTYNFQPSTPLILTQEAVSNLTPYSNESSLFLYGIKGLNMFPWLYQPNAPRWYLGVDLSTIEFYFNGMPPGEYQCKRDMIPDNGSSTCIFYSIIFQTFFARHNKYSSVPVCPHLFKYAYLTSFELDSQVDSFLYTQLLRFDQTDVNSEESIYSIVNITTIKGYNFKVDTSLLHPLVFKNITELYLVNTIASIQSDLFKHFSYLRLLTFELNSVGNFYHSVGVSWMLYLPTTGVTIQVFELRETGSYFYPDRDLCLFASFPQNRSVYLVPLVDANATRFTSCTSTLKWLGRNYYNQPWLDVVNAYRFTSCDNNTSIINDTEIDERLNLCRLRHASGEYQSYNDYYETRILNMFLTQLVPFVCIPCACLLGLFLNWKIIQTISKHKTKDLKEDFYKYMSANAKFNCVYCLILVFYPMNSCIWRPSYLFCSSISTSHFVQYFKIVMIAYVGETVKMCANVSYLMMTLNRFLLIGKDHAPWLIKVAKLECKWVVRGSFIISCLLNIGHVWEYIPYDDVLFENIVNQHMNRLQNSDLVNPNYPLTNYDSMIFFCYIVVNFLINFLAFFVLNTVIEIMIVRRMHKEIIDKRLRMSQMNSSTAAFAKLDESRIKQEKKREEEDNKKERRVIQMVVFNSIFNFILRSPDILVLFENNVSFLYTEINFAMLDLFNPGILNLFVDIGYFAFILTFSTNFFIFYHFNTKFRESVTFISNWKQALK